jgi:catechol 2,3-dioxygenase-like lactoylglutathione lyase family enzyme
VSVTIELFAGVAVTDFERAVAWYERLLGCPATFKAHDTEWVWQLAEHRWIYVVERPDRAGHGLVTWFVDDLDGFLAAAAGRGMRPTHDERYENDVRKVTFTDPDGNEIGVGGVVPATRDAAE